LVEERVRAAIRGAPAVAGGGVPIALADVTEDDARRLPTGIGELDRALGGGLVAGGVVLLAGDPGIGKSTLLMQALARLGAAGASALYVTGEESAAQVAMRARRIGVGNTLMLLATTDLESVIEALSRQRFDVLVIDSIQTLRSVELESAAGAVAQLREVAARLTEIAKRDGVAMFLIGHVTKDGSIAGPKVLEHLVDTVLAFEGDPTHAFRLVRAIKNRFGPAHEVGVFEMAQDGLREVPDPSALFLAERPKQAAGSVVVATAEGTRPLLVEVQALVSPALYGSPRRVATGLDSNRLSVLLAVLTRKSQVHVMDQDVFASVAGGARIDERAADLGLAAAIVSSLRERPIREGTVVFGEVGLAGEVRAVPRANVRVVEAAKMGFRHIVMPALNAERLTAAERKGLEISGVRTLDDALRALD
jgi:DNA repair protein RadA/Sms